MVQAATIYREGRLLSLTSRIGGVFRKRAILMGIFEQQTAKLGPREPEWRTYGVRARDLDLGNLEEVRQALQLLGKATVA